MLTTTNTALSKFAAASNMPIYLFLELCKHADTVIFLWVVMETHHPVSLVYCCKDLIVFNLCKHSRNKLISVGASQLVLLCYTGCVSAKQTVAYVFQC